MAAVETQAGPQLPISQCDFFGTLNMAYEPPSLQAPRPPGTASHSSAAPSSLLGGVSFQGRSPAALGGLRADKGGATYVSSFSAGALVPVTAALSHLAVQKSDGEPR